MVILRLSKAETAEAEWMSCLRMSVLVLACCLLAGCQDFWRNSGAWDIGPHRGLLLDVSNYYHAMPPRKAGAASRRSSTASPGRR
ncbi:MAG: hypothetical protein HC871_17185 [Rhizobiales bacterium]|nr:hypothetical protein [Hyphomicrobiales bacterium]